MKNISTADTISDLEAQGIKVIPIKYTELKVDLNSFINTVKAFGENIVFMEEFSFVEDDFLYDVEKPVLGDYNDPPNEEGINLIQFLPALSTYKNYLEQTCLLVFRVFYRNQVFSYRYKAEWYEGFMKLFEEAGKIFEDTEKAIKEQLEQQQNAAREVIAQRETNLRNLLEDFADDDKFIGLKTQKAKQEYAIARYPELSQLPLHILKEDISNLNARIQARKLLQ